MQLSDNNMDDLFRKAAADYPLKTDNDDWDAVAGRLAGAEGAPAEKIAPKNYRKLLLLLLLLPLGAIGYYALHNNETSNSSFFKPKQNNLTQNNNSDKNTSEKTTQQNTLTVTATIQNAFPQSISKDNGNKESADLRKTNSNSAIVVNDNHSVKEIISQHDLSLNNLKQSANKTTDLSTNEQHNSLPLNSAATNFNSNIVRHNNENSSDKLQTALVKNDSSENKKDISLSAPKTDTAKTAAAKKQVKSLFLKQHYFYAGALAGIDASTVKFQSVKNAGYSLGVLIGYKFTNHFSVESGLLWDKKKYYTDGKYFNETKAGFPSGDQILNMNGSCSMFEIPLAVKYDFAQKAHSSFFATAGLSSYLMKKEGYDYTASYYGDVYTANKSYSNSSRNWFSVAQFSVGYQKQVSKNYTFRIEPYIKLPLSGVGIGSLPISSAGLNIGITRIIH